ncbi:PHP domain-containing protein [Leptolyngbya sp. FACHB-261]|uniref:PHP domain-containing protein n=1 Tax=Leptolyngbya sp. FACHB-261 TaxID=2692806 RepID=UPI001685F618|nr:PHP domain-containing protein [Leptolyngbya sp. FACHB-261]MBD2100748.1 PHP domain-containing protein [Leptolyngbya sp. FACHB-261]
MSNPPNVSRRLSQLATLLEIRGDNPFRVNAYSKAARTLRAYDLADLLESGTLTSIQGIGKGLAEEITALAQTGTSPLWEQLRTELPVEGLLEIAAVPGLGTKSIRSIYQTLHISSLGELEYACQENRLVELEGFGARKQSKILQEIARIKRNRSLFRYSDVMALAKSLIEQLLQAKTIAAASVTGKCRRAWEVLEGLELVVQGEPQTVASILNHLAASLAEPAETLATMLEVDGSTVRTVLDGLPVTVYCCQAHRYGWTLLQTTGSAEHLQALGDPSNIADSGSEAEIYQRLGLPWIPPELREGTGEVEAARRGELPELLRRSDLRGVLHLHTTYSDGAHSLEAMVQAALQQGYEYVGISDHSQAAFYAGGLKPIDIVRQHQEIDRLNAEYAGQIRILKGIEADILLDGSLDYEADDPDILQAFDFVVASVHSQLKMPFEAMTQRLIRAVSHPRVTMLGHWSGRILLGRQGSQFNHEAVLAAAAAHGTAIEFNASPYRLDLDWRELRTATEQGIQICVNPDAHSTDGFAVVDQTLAVTHKGWLQANQTLNAQGVDAFLSFAAKQH